MSSELTFEELYQAYIDCRRRKRGTKEAIEFETDENYNLLCLFNELNERTYKVSQSYVFVVDKPKPREVFAAKYRDRIVHHLFYNRIIDNVEKDFIPTTYSCRKGMGNLKAINDSYEYMMNNLDNDLYVFKGDIEGFFMSINKDVLHSMVLRYVEDNLTLFLLDLILWNDPTENCIFKSPRYKWRLINDNKSLFKTNGKGLPIGNLPSQMFANVYMNELGKYVEKAFGLSIFIYVDDFVVFFEKGVSLKAVINGIEQFLKEVLGLKLHENKRYFQHCSKGYKFVGGIVKPYRKYIPNEIKYKFYLNLDNNDKFISYWGLMKHYKTYNIKKIILWLLI